MRVTNLKIKNFRSFQNIELDGLTELTVLIGKNDSGKSSIFEALRMLFEWSRGASASSHISRLSGTEYLWFGADPGENLNWRSTLECT